MWRKWPSNLADELAANAKSANHALWKLLQQYVLEPKEQIVTLTRFEAKEDEDFAKEIMLKEKNKHITVLVNRETSGNDPWVPLIEKMLNSGLGFVKNRLTVHHSNIQAMQDEFFSPEDKKRAAEADLRTIVEKICYNSPSPKPRI